MRTCAADSTGTPRALLACSAPAPTRRRSGFGSPSPASADELDLDLVVLVGVAVTVGHQVEGARPTGTGEQLVEPGQRLRLEHLSRCLGRWVLGDAEEIPLGIGQGGPLHVRELVQDVPPVGGTEADEALDLGLS